MRADQRASFVVTPLPEGAASRLALLRRREKEKEKIFQSGYSVASHVTNAGFRARFAVSRARTNKDKAPYKLRMAQYKSSANVPTDRKAEHIYLGPSALTKTATWSPIASIVSGVSPLELATPAPIVEAAAEVLQVNKRGASLRAEAPVGIAGPACLEEPGRGGIVGV